MTTSEQINELATALAAAQAEMGGAVKDSQNPHFKSKYADLASVRDAARPLAKHGIAVIQSCRMATVDGGMVAEVETRMVHRSGQWMADTLAVPVSKTDAQGIGSALTYGRRYSLAAFAGIAPEDDDGEAAVGRNGQAKRDMAAPPAKFEDTWLDLTAACDEGTGALKAAWDGLSTATRTYITTHKRTEWETLKVKAAQAGVPA